MNRVTQIELLVSLRYDWTLADYTAAYADEWDEIPATVAECRERMSEHIFHKYSDGYIQDILKTEHLHIDGVEIIGFETLLYGEREDEHEIDLGGLYLSCEGREYVLDVRQAYSTVDKGFTTIKMDLERDEDTFPVVEHKYDLTATDLYDSDLKAMFYIRSDLNVESISLFVKHNGCTKAIDVKIDE